VIPTLDEYLSSGVPAVHAGSGLAFASGKAFCPLAWIGTIRNHPRLNSGNRQVPEIENAMHQPGQVIGIRQSSNIRAHK
jgi:hypothetical protein